MQIQVPFAYQCKLSGVSDKKNHEILWYKKSFQVDRAAGERVLLHFGAVDYLAELVLNWQVKMHGDIHLQEAKRNF